MLLSAATAGGPEPAPQPPLPDPTPGSPPVPAPGPLPGDPGPPLPTPAPAPASLMTDTTTITVEGDIDISTGPSIAERVRSAVEEGSLEVRLDLAGATFVDSAGLVALLEARGAAASGGARLVLQQPSVSVRDLLWLTGLLGSFELE